MKKRTHKSFIPLCVLSDLTNLKCVPKVLNSPQHRPCNPLIHPHYPYTWCPQFLQILPKPIQLYGTLQIVYMPLQSFSMSPESLNKKPIPPKNVLMALLNCPKAIFWNISSFTAFWSDLLWYFRYTIHNRTACSWY